MDAVHVSEVVSQDRAKILDSLRGFALFGILIINGMSILAVNGSTPAFTIAIPLFERILQDAILFFIESKFFTLFSLLFGIGFAIQIQSAERQGRAFLPRIVRRMIGLLVFGLLHIVLLWDGDILVIYAITGTLLIFFRTVSFTTVWRWVIGLLAIPAVLVFGVFLYTIVVRMSPAGAVSLGQVDQELIASFADTAATDMLRTSGFVQGITERVATYISLLPLLLSRIPTVLAMFLMGLYLGKTMFFRDIAAHIALLKKIRIYGLGIGFGLMALIVASTKLLPATTALVAIIEDQYLAGPILCLGFAATFTLLFIERPQLQLFEYFSTVGKMALSNYIGQSLVLTFIAYGWGLGLARALNGFQALAIFVILYIVQIICSGYWQRYFQYGPLEWMWRCITYWQIMPLQKR